MRSQWPRGLTLISFSMAVLVAAPIIVVILNVFEPVSEVWSHIAGTMVPRYLATTLWLALGVGIGTTVLGVGAAWLVVTYRFTGRRFVEWVLILPLSIPTYVLAYAYYDLTSVSGPLQTALRDITGLGARDYWFPHVASTQGAIFLLTFALYPYVYLLARSAFLQQAGSTLEVGRMLGCTQAEAFVRVMLPLSRPAIVVGVSLVLMETLAEYGAVSLLGVQTFTTGIYRAWFSMGDRVASAQLATMLLGVVLVLLLAERMSRRGAYHNPSSEHRLRSDHRLHGIKARAAYVACLLPPLIGFAIPAAHLLNMAIGQGMSALDFRLLGYASNSFLLAAVTAVIACAIGLLMVYGARLSTSRWANGANRVASLGYAIPGPVIAVGTLVPLAAFDNVVNAWFLENFGIRTGLLLTGGIAAMVFAYLVRFMTISIGNIEAGFAKVRPSIEDAASVLGSSGIRRLLTIHAPLIWPSVATAAVLVFVDVMKELPATLIMRPFNFDTLAVRVYNLARDERLAEAAAPAILLILVGLVPVILLSRQITKSKRKKIR